MSERDGNEEILSEKEGSQEQDTVAHGTDWPQEKEKMQQHMASLEKEKKDLFEQVLRKQADFENYKKRVLRERASLRDEVLGDFIKKLLPLLDNLERALVSDEKESEKGLREGLELIHKQFLSLLKEEGVEEIICTGEAFNPHIHEAVMQVDSEEHAENIVVNELQRGYRLKERILRCSMVTVAK